MSQRIDVGTRVQVRAWGAWNGIPPDLARLPIASAIGVVVGHRRDEAHGAPTYTVRFWGYGEIQVLPTDEIRVCDDR